MTTLQELEQNGVIAELARLFCRALDALTQLEKAGIDPGLFPPFEASSPQKWWHAVFRDLEAGRSRHGGVDDVLAAVADTYPSSNIFRPWLAETSLPDNRSVTGGSVDIIMPDGTTNETFLTMWREAVEAAKLGVNVKIRPNYATRGSEIKSMTLEGLSDEEYERLSGAMQEISRRYDTDIRIERSGTTFRDYITGNIIAEGPDGQRFALEEIRATTPVSEVARAVMHQYRDSAGSQSHDRRQQAVVDRVTDGGSGSTRLDPRTTLHEAGVRPGDTLRVAPERTAGAVDPLLREEALARVRVQVLAYAQAHSGFQVTANSLVAPTEYVFRFRIPGFASPTGDGLPRPIDFHEVLVELPPDFPVAAPVAWWQTDIFHPNIDPHNGLVCLGALQKYYRPGMDFAELCQMLVDMAGYRTYTLEEGYNAAAARWALSPAGLQAIHAAGGITLVDRLIEDSRPLPRLNITTVDL